MAPAAGPQAALSFWIENLAPDADLNNLRITADGRDCRPIYIGEPAADGVSQVTAWLPEGLRTGLVPVEAILRRRPGGGPGLGAHHAGASRGAAHRRSHRRHQPA